jgi:hypothetical protein
MDEGSIGDSAIVTAAGSEFLFFFCRLGGFLNVGITTLDREALEEKDIITVSTLENGSLVTRPKQASSACEQGRPPQAYLRFPKAPLSVRANEAQLFVRNDQQGPPAVRSPESDHF